LGIEQPPEVGMVGRRGERPRPKLLPRVIVKFFDEVDLPYTEGIEEHLARQGVDPRVGQETLRFHPLYTSLSEEEIRRLMALAQRRDPTYQPRNLLTYFIADCPAGVGPEELARVLAEWPIIEEAYPDQRAEDPQVSFGNDPRVGNQGYLNPAPDGVDAYFAWTLPGGDGAGQAVIDLEQGWTLNHEDLTAHGGAVLFGSVVNTSRHHGTAVLGEICAVDNTVGNVGITPNVASVDVVSHSGSVANVPDAIMTAVANLDFGNILLLEVQVSFLPVETVTACFDTIRLATALGVVVVEAAGNGTNDLDAYTGAGGALVLNRGSADFKDSLAIMVGAANSPSPHSRWNFSNFGSRIDCYGWGENVDSCTSDAGGATTLYTTTFQGTSSASPIITGAGLAVQGMAEASHGIRFSPRQLRTILSDPATGTPSANPATDRIGVMPNLSALAAVLDLRPDVRLRDFVGDSGDPHTGPVSASPDVILRKVPVANPQAAFGQGSGTENDATLGFEAEAGQDNFIYVRVQNRGPVAAANVVADVYWSPVATLVTPALWSLVGSVTVPSVPVGDTLTVSAPITWPAGQIPATGHYCLVAIVGNAADPGPTPVDFLNWNNYQIFIRENNNVTWRNFNVVNNDPSATPDPSGFVVLPFLLAGAPDKGRMFSLQVIGRLPEGARAFLEMPAFLAEALGAQAAVQESPKRRKEPGSIRARVAPHGRLILGEVLLPARAAIPCRLLVDIPKEARATAHEIYISQLHERREVGRITWRLGPARNEESEPLAKDRTRKRSKKKS
jgi:serine protease